MGISLFGLLCARTMADSAPVPQPTSTHTPRPGPRGSGANCLAVFGCDMASTDAGIVMTGAELAEIQVESALGPIPTIPSRFGPVLALVRECLA